MFAHVMAGLVAFEHLYILVLEMFLWTTPRGRRVFGLTVEDAERTKVLAANQGLYNGFLAAGLIASFFVADGRAFRLFFFGCVLVAGLYGGATAGAAAKKILVIQALPAAIGLLAVLL